MKTLSEVVSGLAGAEKLDNKAGRSGVGGVTSDSRQVKPGTVFVAVPGMSQDGHEFIPQAIAQGALAIVGERPALAGLKGPYFEVADARLALGLLAANFHGNPSRSMKMIGVTGTSGKTTTTYLIESILDAAGERTGVIGTVNFRFGGKIFEATHTTPGSVELQRLLADMRDAGCTAVVMEVSSHALKQHRTAHIAFDGVVFTNLSPEHLDFHPDMEDYFRSKALLFTDLVEFSIRAGKKPFAAINAEDAYGKRLLEDLGAKPRPEFRFKGFACDDEIRCDLSGVRGTADSIELRSPLTGRFNVSNILAAVTVASGLGIDSRKISDGIQALKLVPGRLERVSNARGIHVLVDYAHKPDALEKVLQTLREIRGGHRLITVFGCGGDRDRQKRPVMGRLAVELSDLAIVTSDNPRTEDPLSIIEEILAGIRGLAGAPQNYRIEPDRAKAIEMAVQAAKRGDIILIAGKGHEDYQIIADPTSPTKTRKIHFDDREIAAQYLDTGF